MLLFPANPDWLWDSILKRDFSPPLVIFFNLRKVDVCHCVTVMKRVIFPTPWCNFLQDSKMAESFSIKGNKYFQQQKLHQATHISTPRWNFLQDSKMAAEHFSHSPPTCASDIWGQKWKAKIFTKNNNIF